MKRRPPRSTRTDTPCPPRTLVRAAIAGPATVGEPRELYGTVQFSPTARSEIRGQFPGRVVAVTKAVGDYVRRGELLARIESSESLQVYPVHATASGVV